MMLNVPKRANDAMHMSMLDGYDVSLSLFIILLTVYKLLDTCCCQRLF